MKVPAHILLVEDDEIDAEVIFRSFARQKIANPIVHAVDGLEALAMLRGENSAVSLSRPYIILSDINMPRMNGLELLKRIREDPDLNPSVVFILTSSNQVEDKLAAYNAQIAGYILKQKAGQDFREMIRFLECYQSIVELPDN